MKEIASALVKAQRQFGPALKRSTNPAFQRNGVGGRYADLASCIEAVIDALNNNGIFLLQKNYDCSNGIMCETVFVHETGEMLECGIVHFPAVKQDPQGYASALTYARRYSLMAACGIAPEDDDGNAASQRPAPAPKNPLDTIEPSAKPATGAQFRMAIPGKEDRIYGSSQELFDAMMMIRDQIEKAGSITPRLRMTKMRELREANEMNVDRMDIAHKSELVGDYTKRLKRLGAQGGEDGVN
jgi:hypothetical protein